MEVKFVIRYLWIVTLQCVFQHFQLTGGASCFKTQIIAGTDPDVLTTPNYPFAYDTMMTCEWEVTANESIPNAVIKFKVMDSELSQAFPCWIDSITIHDGPRHWYPALYSWCGSKFPTRIITSTRRSARVVFTSGATAHTNRGVKLKYWAAQKVFPQKKAVTMTWVNYTLIAVFLVTVTVILAAIITIFIVHNKKRNLKVNVYKPSV